MPKRNPRRDWCYLGEDVLAVELARSLFVLGREVLAVSAPGRVELNEREVVLLHVLVKGGGFERLDQRGGCRLLSAAFGSCSGVDTKYKSVSALQQRANNSK